MVLQYLYSKSNLRDIKPQNILVNNNTIKICDLDLLNLLMKTI